MTKIWHPNNKISLEKINEMNQNTVIGHLDINITNIGDDFIQGTMPVNENTIQPEGLLHGGASLTLAESLASLGAALCVDMSKYNIVGHGINANHLRSATKGLVTGIAKPLYLGGKTQVWEIKIFKSETKFIDETLCCISRMTALRMTRR